ncbi:MAG: SpoIVB peptidase [Pygmaiobacter sp.]|nr:SpoIVB peptidase [Pygmaiobacter sp.]
MKNVIRWLGRGALAVAALAAVAVVALRCALPDTYTITPGATLCISSMPWLQVQRTAAEAAAVNGGQQDTSENCTLSLFGVLPVKTVRTVSTARRTVTVCGTPFGIKMFSNGALVVAFSDLYTVLGSQNPAKEAGLRLGDLIVSANGRSVRTNDELAEAIAAAGGGGIEVAYLRGETRYTCVLTPAQDSRTGAYKAGVWVRDSSAGIGTLTFIDPLHNTFAGLGHAISDTDTGADIPLLSGEIVPVTVTGIVKGSAGTPGELRGEFAGGGALGSVLANDATGVYGVLSGGGGMGGTVYPVANMQEVQPGEAQMLTTIAGTEAKLYSVRIERVNLTAADPNRNMLIRVTDATLLSTTGGIVQGMSGSPLIQNGQLVGAVTHVLVNDPSRGYAILAETMLTGADACAPAQQAG